MISLIISPFSGWGFLPVFYGPAPSLLPPRNMQILSRDQCTAPHPTQICAINRFYKFNTCVADPGGKKRPGQRRICRLYNILNIFFIGSLSVEYNNLPVLVGVVGKLNQCPLSGSNGEIPGLYTSVPEHLDWIAENTQGTLSCVPYRT